MDHAKRRSIEMFCLNCGNSLHKDDEKCSFCGEPIKQDIDLLVQEENNQLFVQEERGNESKENIETRIRFEKPENVDEKKELLFQDFIEKIDEVENEILEGGYNLLEGEDILAGDFKTDSLDRNEESSLNQIERIQAERIQNRPLQVKNTNTKRGDKKSESFTILKADKPSKNKKSITNKIDFLKFKKIILIVLGLSVGVFSIFTLGKLFFKNNFVIDYVEIERKHFAALFSEMPGEDLKGQNELQKLSAQNIQTQIRIENLNVDKNSLLIMGFGPNDSNEGLSRDLDIIWNRFSENNKSSFYNDLQLFLRNKPLFSIDTFNNGSVFQARFPSVYSGWIRVDLAKENSWSQSLGINEKDARNTSFLDYAGIVSRVFPKKEEKLFGEEIIDILKRTLNKNDVKVARGVEYLYKVEASQNGVRIVTDKYQIQFDKKVFLDSLHALLEKLKTNDESYKVLVDRFMVGLEVIQNLGIDKDRLQDINQESYIEFLEEFMESFKDLDFQEKVLMNVWVDKMDRVVGRELEFRFKGENVEEVFFKLRYSGGGKDYGNRFLEIYFEPAANEPKRIELVLERVVLKDEFTETVGGVIEHFKYEIGNKDQKGYMFFDFFSSRNFPEQNTVDRELKLNFLNKGEQGDFNFDLKIQGEEFMDSNNARASKDLEVIYNISAENSFKGQFNLKVDEAYGEEVTLPSGFDGFLGNNEKTIDLNEINMDDVDRFMIDFQLQYMNYRRKTYELFGLEFFPNLGMSR
jgi:hypothetical protein